MRGTWVKNRTLRQVIATDLRFSNSDWTEKELSNFAGLKMSNWNVEENRKRSGKRFQEMG